MSKKPWYEELFGETYLRMVQQPSREATEQEVDFLVERLRLEPGLRVLDLCCGFGRHAVPLARRGLRVVGQDLDRGREAASEAGVEVEWVRRDMREISWEAEFDAAINMFTAFGYFEEDEENFRVLEGVARALKPGGRFLIDLISYAWLMRHWEARGWRDRPGGLITLEEREMDWLRGIQEVEHTLIEPDGSRRRLRHRLRLFTPHELTAWLRRAGLEPEALCGDVDGTPFHLDSHRMFLVSRKP